MEKNPYLSIMIQSLKKKSAVLDAVIELNIRLKHGKEVAAHGRKSKADRTAGAS